LKNLNKILKKSWKTMLKMKINNNMNWILVTRFLIILTFRCSIRIKVSWKTQLVKDMNRNKEKKAVQPSIYWIKIKMDKI
jgi:hypothetical protein